MLVYFIVAIDTVQSRVSFVTLGRRGDTIYFDLYSILFHPFISLPLGLVRGGGAGTVWGRRLGEVDLLYPLSWVSVSSSLYYIVT